LGEIGIITRDDSFGKSILRALLVLEQFNSNVEIGIKELSISTGLPPSTIQRIVNTLELKNYLTQNPKNNKYRLGIALYNISKSFAEDLDWIEGAKMHMESLVNKHEETVNLAILQGRSIAYLKKVDSPHILRPSFTVGTQYPAICTALGKCILAFQPKEVVDRILATPLEKCTADTVTDPEELKEEFSKIRYNGYSTEDEQFQKGLYCIATPIKDYKGKVIAAISMTIPKLRLEKESIPEIISDMIKTANEISGDIMKTNP
jgi:IclR family KDG regulon transcriptional repressor